MASFMNASGASTAHHRSKKKRKNKPELEQYRERNQQLRNVGWENYKRYLEGDIWKRIRQEEFKRPRICEICRVTACQLHHWSYEIEVMMGAVREHLIPLCRDCHEKIEFGDDEKKLSLPDANRRLHGLSHYPSGLWNRIQKGWRKIESLKHTADLNEESRCKNRKGNLSRVSREEKEAARALRRLTKMMKNRPQ
jgi:hypothetical protein